MGSQEFSGGFVLMYGNGTVVTRADFITRSDVPEPPANLNITKVGECMSATDGLLKIYTQTQEPGKLSLNDATKTPWHITLTKTAPLPKK